MPVAVSTGGALSGKVMVAVAAGNAHNLALCADGTAVAWRDNTFGQLGNNSTTQYNAPVVVNTNGVLAGKMVVAVAAGFAHSLALCSDGTLAAWGDNSYGQLGTGNNPPSLVPVAVNRAGVLAGKTINGIAAGSDHCLALTSDGKVVAWGWNGEGELGNNSTTDSNVTVAVVSTGVLLGKTVTAVSAGQDHSLVLTWRRVWIPQASLHCGPWGAPPSSFPVARA